MELNIFDIVKEAEKAFLQAPEELVLSEALEYMLIITEKGFADTGDRDVERVTYRGNRDGKCIFEACMEIAGQRQTYACPTEDHAKKWFVIPVTSVMGGTLSAAFDETVQAVIQQAPPELKDKIRLNKFDPFLIKNN